jgi:6-phosphogluconolactonase
MSIHIFETEQELLFGYADLFVKVASEAQTIYGEFNVVLSGGNSPKKLYRLLASPDYSKQIVWEKINFFLGDERYVSIDDPESNARMIKEALFEPMNIPASQIYTIDTSLPMNQAAEKYMHSINTFFSNRYIQFDLVMLGLGENVHTASLFPNTPVLKETAATIKSVFIEKQNIYRITMTAELINQAHHVAFLVFGASKAPAVWQVLKGKTDKMKYPAQLIKPKNGSLYLYLDKATASLL